jgi:hypothetical protein
MNDDPIPFVERIPYAHKVVVKRGLLSAEIDEIRVWLSTRAGAYEGDYFPHRSFYSFTDPQTAMEFRLRWC